jgi:hypothetical protein
MLVTATIGKCSQKTTYFFMGAKVSARRSNLMRYLHDKDVDFGYWALNPRKPTYDVETYGLLHDDWKTPIESDFRLADMQNLAREGDGTAS